MSWTALVARAFERSLLNPEFLYFAMGAISLGGLGLAAAVVTRQGSFAPDSALARHAQRIRGAVPAVVLMSVVTLVVGLQGNFERAVQEWHGWDFTYIVYAIEGNAAERFQDALRNPFLDTLLVVIYSTGAFLTYHVPFLALVLLGRGRSAMRLAVTLAIVWSVGIVCYFFVPVYEVWVTASPPYEWTHVQNVYFEKIPAARTSEAYQTAINNNFPSLHVGVTSAIAFTLLLARERWIGIPVAVIATGVAVATVYLGIHWFLDVVAGLLLSGSAAWFVHRRFPLEEKVFKLTWGKAPAAEAPAAETP